MRNLVRRVKRLEQQHFDATGLVPRSEAWYEFYWDKMDRLMGGEQIDMKIPLEAFYELPHRREEPEQLESTSIAYSDGVESDPIVPDFLRYMGRG